MLEIVLVPYEEGIVGQYPGIFLFSNVSRMMRPVLHLASQKIEMIGTFEQVYLNIAVTQSEIIPEVCISIC
jgi:DNA-directed RNA polymerase I subunit RPA2